MRIIIGDKSKDSMKILGIESFPFTEKELKTKFRSLILKCHEDKGGTKEESMRVIEAYKHLKNLALSNAVVTEEDRITELEKRDQEEDIFALYDDCPDCKGKGKKEVKHDGRKKDCPHCDESLQDITHLFFSWSKSSGFKTLICYPCNGTGKFKTKNDKEVTCRKCEGKGTFTVLCKFCKGTGFTKEKPYTESVRCYKCKATGKVKIEPWNPVIRKGAVMK